MLYPTLRVGLLERVPFCVVSSPEITRPFLLYLTSIQPSTSPSASRLVGSLSSSPESLLGVSPDFCIIYVHFGVASDPLANNSASLITLPEAGVGLVGVGLAEHTCNSGGFSH
ncbi:hypothetical protein MRX96_040066 [Rhipicephalus microplus]